jgi:hypothetical protein
MNPHCRSCKLSALCLFYHITPETIDATWGSLVLHWKEATGDGDALTAVITVETFMRCQDESRAKRHAKSQKALPALPVRRAVRAKKRRKPARTRSV